jgi:hypothetical protein
MNDVIEKKKRRSLTRSRMMCIMNQNIRSTSKRERIKMGLGSGSAFCLHYHMATSSKPH